MLGQKIGDHTGKVTSQRVLPSEGGPPRVETSFQANERILGVDAHTLGTYISVMRPDGFLQGQGQGVVMGSGGEMATWIGSGVGRFTESGGISFRGALYYQTPSEKWARLNGIATVFEYEIDAESNTKASIWEWK